MFHDMANQISEFLNDDIMEIEQPSGVTILESDASKKDKNAEKEEFLEAKIIQDTITIEHKNVENITVSFFEIDIEIFFSKNPLFSHTVKKININKVTR